MRAAPSVEPPVRSAPERLHRGSEIRSVLRSGQRSGGRYVVVHIRDRVDDPDGRGRAAVVAGRRLGSAVRRNRAKRRLRAAARECGVPKGRDVVLVARPGADRAPWDDICREVARACKRGANA